MTPLKDRWPSHIGTTTDEPACASASPELVIQRQLDALGHWRLSELANECGNAQPSRGLERMATVEHDSVDVGLDRHPGAAKVPK
jgi:hypothetical protein